MMLSRIERICARIHRCHIQFAVRLQVGRHSVYKQSQIPTVGTSRGKEHTENPVVIALRFPSLVARRLSLVARCALARCSFACCSSARCSYARCSLLAACSLVVDLLFAFMLVACLLAAGLVVARALSRLLDARMKSADFASLLRESRRGHSRRRSLSPLYRFAIPAAEATEV